MNYFYNCKKNNWNKFKKKIVYFKGNIHSMCIICKQSFKKGTKVFTKTKSNLNNKPKSTELIQKKKEILSINFY